MAAKYNEHLVKRENSEKSTEEAENQKRKYQLQN